MAGVRAGLIPYLRATRSTLMHGSSLAVLYPAALKRAQDTARSTCTGAGDGYAGERPLKRAVQALWCALKEASLGCTEEYRATGTGRRRSGC